MKAKNRSQYLIPIAVILCSLVLLAAMTFALSGYAWSAGGRQVDIEFHDATGIKLHSPVKYAGKTAGAVARIRYLSQAERLGSKDRLNAVRVTVRLQKEVPPLPADVTAKLDAETVLGEKFIALSAGLPETPTLAEGAVIQGGEVTSIDGFVRSAQAAVTTANGLLTKLQSDYPSLIPRLAELLDQGNSVLSQSSNLVRNADGTILNANQAVSKLREDYADLVPRLNSLLTQAKILATNADLTIQRVSVLVDRVDGVVKNNEGDLAKILEELRVVSQNLKVVTTYAKTLTGTLAEKPSRLIWGGKANALPSEKKILDSKEPLPFVQPPK